ncbi:inositol 1,4,5-trisphosphate receptor-interacting protein-like [Protopterus annectens]|uniref:inositol 1,4,5-trisphosphate receptor-interacting protein-like n=1 Tax=Protopterus annectens TaxID=7888 RepID=UPI001CFB7A08|nr:inositol 1,4,5-trisphosphate receptor-interacting protein-like [Protopterus annectens]XP_043938253.1 inositol 1,4,5-trisphosphate receptor-interacting protein-like [Protopterus annectens]
MYNSSAVQQNVIYQELSNMISFTSDEIQTQRELTENVVKKLLNKMRELSVSGDPVIEEDIIGTGSSFEGLKVREELEFDFMIPICSLSPYSLRPEFGTDKRGMKTILNMFGQIRCIQLHNVIESQSRYYKKPADFKEKFCDRDYLSPKRIREWFQSLADRAVIHIKEKNMDLTFSQQGPARTLKININKQKTISVDLVPAVKTSDIYLVAKPYGGSPEDYYPSNDNLWRMSFSVQERLFLEQKALTLPINSCHRQALKIMKYIKQKERNNVPAPNWSSCLSSYHLKTAWLYLLQQNQHQEWQPSCLRERVLELIIKMIDSLEKKQLYHFFLGNTALLDEKVISDAFLTHHSQGNLLSEMNSDTLQQASSQLRKLQHNLDSMVNEIHQELRHQNSYY